MGNYRFRFSDMIPNAWFYKLKDMSKTRKRYNPHQMKKKPPPSTSISSPQKSHISQPRYSYYFTSEPTKSDKFFYNSPRRSKASDIHFPDSPRRSSKKKTRRKTIYKPSPKLVSACASGGCRCHAPFNTASSTNSSPSQSPDYSPSPLESSPEPYLNESITSESDCDEFAASDSSDHQLASWSSSCNCRVSSSTADIIIDMNNESFSRKFGNLDGLDVISKLELPPILTKPAKLEEKKNSEVNSFKRRTSKLQEMQAHSSVSVKVVKEENVRTQREQRRKSSSTSPGIRLRSSSPRIASKKIQAHTRKSVPSNTGLKSKNKSLSESFAVVKSSVDPQRDFRDSMMEMIVENNIRASKDLEELLACYLQLNSSEYHDLIVKAFEQIWFDMTDQRL